MRVNDGLSCHLWPVVLLPGPGARKNQCHRVVCCLFSVNIPWFRIRCHFPVLSGPCPSHYHFHFHIHPRNAPTLLKPLSVISLAVVMAAAAIFLCQKLQNFQRKKGKTKSFSLKLRRNAPEESSSVVTSRKRESS